MSSRSLTWIAACMLVAAAAAGCQKQAPPPRAESEKQPTAEAPAAAGGSATQGGATEGTAPGASVPGTMGTGAGTEGGAMTTMPSGLKYVDMVVGTGPSPQPGQVAVVHYTGWLKDGKKFDSSLDRGQPFSFPIGRGAVIKGWDEGVATMKVGGKRKLIIPPSLGYGDRGAGGMIPPGAELTFDVELLGVQ